MTESPEKFGELLTKALHRIRSLNPKKKFAIIQDELGYALGKEGQSAIYYWRKGNIPSIMNVEKLARELVKQGGLLNRKQLDIFLRCADYPNVTILCDELFPTPPSSELESVLVTASLTTDRLIWEEIHGICTNITENRMATVRHKYHQELYLQRDKTRQAFENFLVSDKRCFVLTGKSGVGKSNFLLALEQEFQHSPHKICILMYDGANLPVIEASITEGITQDFNDRLLAMGRGKIEEVWSEIAQLSEMKNRLIVLCVDAINENAQAKELLRQLNELVQRPWPWLKVVFSSRPETWQTIKRGVRLAEALYYKDEETKTLGVELEPFTYSEQLKPFSRQELPATYAKYQQAFRLKTRYEDLQSETRELLRDPLSLRLVAETYIDQEVPTRLKTIELITRYIDALLLSERLQETDLQFLEKWLVPLMVDHKDYANTIPLTDIILINDERLGKVDRFGANQASITQALTNLLDTEILVRQSRGREQKIAFKYERFYEYFVGKVFFERLGTQEIWVDKYVGWLTQLPQSPYLWGAIKSCLEQQIRSLPSHAGASLCIQLTQVRNQQMEEILVTALTTYGYDESIKVEQIVEQMLKKERNWLKAFQADETKTAQCPTWKRAAINIASNLKLSRLIEFALTDPSPSVRAVAIRHAFIFWQQEHEAGFKILRILGEKAIRFGGVPIPHILESALGISMLILFDDFSDTETAGNLRQIWRRIIEQLLWVNSNKLHSRVERGKRQLLGVILRLITGFIVRITSETQSNSPLNALELKQFFNKDTNKRRVIVDKLVDFMDTTHTNGDEFQNTLLDLAEERDIFIAFLALTALQKQAFVNSKDILSVVEALFERAIKVEQPGPFGIVVTTGIIIREIEYPKEEWDNFHFYTIKTYLDRFRGQWWSNLHVRRATLLTELCLLESGTFADIPISATAKKYLHQLISDKDYKWIKDIIEWDLRYRGIEAGYLRFAFSVLEMLIDIQDPLITEAITDFLVRTRTYYPNEVDDFMEVNELDEQFIAIVRTRASPETIGDLLGLRALLFWNVRIVGRGKPEFWQKAMWCFRQLPTSRNLEEWFVIVFKVIINEIYDGPVFTDAPG